MNYSHFSSRKVLEIEKIIIHERYSSPTVEHDIALLKLKEKVDLSIYTPACLAPKDADYTGKTASVYGWGDHFEILDCEKSKPKPNISSVLKQTTQTIESNDKCKQGNGTIRVCDAQGNVQLENVSMANHSRIHGFTDDMLCGYNSGTGFCHGDSGGPLTVDVDGKHTLVGVVSWSYGCAEVSVPQVWINTNSISIYFRRTSRMFTAVWLPIENGLTRRSRATGEATSVMLNNCFQCKTSLFCVWRVS